MSTPTIVELMEIQGSDETVTPSQALIEVRSRGRRLSRRTLGFWQEQGLLPPAMRAGARGGLYPQIAVNLIDWIAMSRERGLSLDTIRELAPVWLHLTRSEVRHHVDVGVFERFVRGLGLSMEANYHVPGVVHDVMSWLCADCLGEIEWTMKDGTSRRHRPESEIRLGFVIGAIEPETGTPRIIAWTQLTLPGIGDEPDINDPALIVLGLPNGISFGSKSAARSTRRHRRPREPLCRQHKMLQEEMLL